MLNQWLLSLFNVKRFEDLAEPLRNEALEGLDENNVHHFHHALTAQLFNLTQLPTELLLEYDQNIVRHTQRLNDRRIARGEEPIVWKYFQYLTLLFTEIYLDRYFRDAPALLAAVNTQVAIYNEDKLEADRVPPFDTGAEAWPQLNKLAYWSATGSGKTLLMHANILQFQHWLEKHGRRRELNRVILLTPNEGLSQQHLREFTAAGIDAELFSKDGRGLFSGQSVEILEVTKLRDEMGEKTIAVDAFESNNLVLIDEGHRGASAGEEGSWMRFRNALCEKGFSFEYSATFGQAVKGKPKLVDLYAKSILFDYSYRFFYGDGFGKDYQILNLDDATQENHLELYLVACLLSFFQQQRLFREEGATFRPFNIEKPLWIFVGGSVTATLATRDASDIVAILQFLESYTSNRARSIQRIDTVLNQGLVTATGKNLFAERFKYLNACGLTPAQVFDETLETLFNAPAGGHLYVENLKGATGEVALRLGAENEAFGVINVGDDAKLVKLCEQNGLAVGEREFTGSLFHEINKPDSPVNLLIGSKKFTEGWSSWRVSTMGLMNVGQGEGAQIIQLFGRGVRLKGFDLSLKRTSGGMAQLPQGLLRPKHIGVLETLGIFGVHASYMAQFRDFLREEGLPTNDDRIELLLPVIKNVPKGKLKTIRLKKSINGKQTEFGVAFRELGPVPTVAASGPDVESTGKVLLNWYPKIQAMRSSGAHGGEAEASRHSGTLTNLHLAFLDWDQIFFELEQFKAERGWFNLNIPRDSLPPLLGRSDWYQLFIPETELRFSSFANVSLWQEIATSLLKEYVKRFYRFKKSAWELPHLEYHDVTEDDANLADRYEGDTYYQVLIDERQTELITKVRELKTLIDGKKLKPWEFQGLKTVLFDRHLYAPLLYLDTKVVDISISPVALNKGERDFVEDLRSFHEGNKSFFADKELYLLRNQSKGRGVGFFEAGNFYPDFILWLVVGSVQTVIFVDPKGLRQMGEGDPKIDFHKTIQDIERRMADATVRLRSFIVSNTSFVEMKNLWTLKPGGLEKLNESNVFFQVEQKDEYVRLMLERAIAP